MYEPEPDPPWGLNIFDVDQIIKYYGDSNQNDVKISHEQYANESLYDPFCNNVDGDQSIEHCLQEFSNLSVAEGPDSLQLGNGLHEYSFAQDFPSTNSYSGISNHLSPQTEKTSQFPFSIPFSLLVGYCLALNVMLFCFNFVGYMFGPGETDDVAPSSSCSSPGDGSYDGEEHSYDLEIVDESELDGEVGKRLHQMIPVPVSVSSKSMLKYFLDFGFLLHTSNVNYFFLL